VDLLFETPQGMQAVEIKSGSTFASDWPDAILKWQKYSSDAALTPVIVYGGEGDYVRQACRVVGWRELQGLDQPVDGCKNFRVVAPVEYS
jgi:uncharacterized protein